MSISRGDSVAARAAEQGLDLVVTGSLPEVRWLTGFTGSNAAVACGGSLRLLVTDFRYVEQVADQADGFDTAIADGDLFETLFGELPSVGGAIGYDPSLITAKRVEQLKGFLPTGWEAVAVDDLVAPLRSVKDAAEVRAIAAAAELADAAFLRAVEGGLTGRTERAIAWDLERAARELGAEGMSFPPIVAGGAHGALPHAEPRDAVVESGQLVVIDWGVVVDGYCSDCTRTVCAGPVGEEELEVHRLVLEAEAAGVDSLRPGRLGSEVDAVSRSIIDAAGHGRHFGHGLGHGVGLEIHEAPTLSRKGGTVPLQTGMVVTVEPGVYVPGAFGVRIEDLCVVEPDGARVLTSLDRGPIDLG